MKANELRIGNLLLGSIYFDQEEARQDLGEDYSEEEEWKITEVEGIPHQFENCTAWTDQEYNRLQPIPLTEEWLIRFGFKIFDWGGDLLDYQIGYDGNFILTVGKGYILSKNINYVHQLQNLYFALTGEELEIK